MKYIVPIIALVLLAPSALYAMQRPVFSHLNLAFNTGGTRYLAFEGGTAGTNSSAFAGAATPQASAGMVSNLSVIITAAPGAGKSHAVTLYRNNVATALTCTISDTAITCADDTHTIPYVAGDLLAWQQVPTGTPAVSSGFITASDVHGLVGEVSFGGGGASASASAYNYWAPYGGTAQTAEASSTVIMPTDGVITKLYGQLGIAAGAGASFTLYLNQNGATTTQTCVITGTGVLQCNDNAHPITVAAGDTISVTTIPGGGITGRQIFYGWAFKPTTDGEAPVWFKGGGISNSNRFNPLVGNIQDSGLETISSSSVGIPYSVKKLYITINNVPGGVTTRTIALRINGATQALTATIASAATSASDLVNTVAVSANQFVNWINTVSGSPAAVQQSKASAVTYIAPPTGITVVDATSGSAASGTAISCTKPSGTASGDVVIAIIQSNGPQTMTDNNGATPMTKDFTSASFATANVTVWSRYAGGSEPASYAFTAGGSDRWTIQCYAFRGVDGTNKYDVAPSNSTFSYTGGAGGTTATSTAITTVTDGALVFTTSAIDTGTATLATQMPADSFIGLQEVSTNQPQNAVYKVIPTATTQASVSWSYAVTVLPGVTTFALKPTSGVVSTVGTTTIFNGVTALFNGITALFR